MDKYEYKLKTEQMFKLINSGAYDRAAEIADSIDWRRVRNAAVIANVSDVYEKVKNYQKSYDVLKIAYHRVEESRKILYRLCTLALKTRNVDEAIDFYEEFIQAAPKDPNQYILRYQILRARRAPIEQQIEALELFKKAEYIEEWAYELACLYQEAGMTAECLEECDDLILWFSEGEYVYQAMELKMQYKPLTPMQQEKYDRRHVKASSETEEFPSVVEYKKKEQSEEQHLEPKADAEKASQDPMSAAELLQKKKIGNTMRLGEALRSLLNLDVSKTTSNEAAAEKEKEDPTEEEPFEELQTAIEEIESVADLELIEQVGGKKESVEMKTDPDLKELKPDFSEEENREVLEKETVVEELLKVAEAEQAADTDGEDENKESGQIVEESSGEENETEVTSIREEKVLEEISEEAGAKQDSEEEKIKDIGAEIGLEGLKPEKEEEVLSADVPAEQSEEDTEEKEKKMQQAEDVQIAGQMSFEDLLEDWKTPPQDEEDKEPALSPEIQRMIDEIEGVIPVEAPEKKSKKSAAGMKARSLEDNMGAIADQLRIDEDMEEFEDYEEAEEEAAVEDEAEEVLEEAGEELENEFTGELEAESAEELKEELPEELERENAEELVEEFIEEQALEELEAEDETFWKEDEYDEVYEGEAYEEEYLEEDEDSKEASLDEEDDDTGSPQSEFYWEEEEYEGTEEEYDTADDYGKSESVSEDYGENDYDDDREIPDDDEEIHFLSATAPLSRKETAKMIATGRTAPLPIDEISDAMSISDTGFIVHGRYDLKTQSGIGTRAGLTEEQKKLFSYFVPVRGMSEQLVDVLEQDKNCTNRKGTSRTGNLLIIGNKGNGKTVLAVDVVKAIQKQRENSQGKVAIVTGESLNKKKISDIFEKLYGGALIIEKAGRLDEKTVARLNKAMEQDTGELLVVLEDQRKPLDRLMTISKEFRRKFTSRLEVPILINDELVTFGQTYAQENGYRIDEMGILALYSRIDAMQREDHAVTIAEVKEVLDEAITHSQKVSAKKLMRKMFRRNTDEADRIILSERDFNI